MAIVIMEYFGAIGEDEMVVIIPANPAFPRFRTEEEFDEWADDNEDLLNEYVNECSARGSYRFRDHESQLAQDTLDRLGVKTELWWDSSHGTEMGLVGDGYAVNVSTQWIWRIEVPESQLQEYVEQDYCCGTGLTEYNDPRISEAISQFGQFVDAGSGVLSVYDAKTGASVVLPRAVADCDFDCPEEP